MQMKNDEIVDLMTFKIDELVEKASLKRDDLKDYLDGLKKEKVILSYRIVGNTVRISAHRSIQRWFHLNS